MKSKDYVFTERHGELAFVGDFDGYYNDCDDPWEQSGAGGMASYYEHSRSRLLRALREMQPSRILEVGCGLGYTTHIIANDYQHYAVTGCDVSAVALGKARQRFPELRFEQWNIADALLCEQVREQYDTVILNQLLWYVLDDLDTVFANALQLLTPNGALLIANAFARTQRYGNNIIKGYSGAVERFMAAPGFRLQSSHYYDEGDEHSDGHFTLIKSDS